MLASLSRKNRFLLLLVGLLAFPALFLDHSFSLTPVAAPVLSGSGPPSAADWVIASDTVIEDEHYILNGSIVIESGANLTLTNVTLWMKSLYGEPYNITVNSGGELYLHNCTVTAYNPDYRWFLAAKAGSTLLLNATTLSYTGFGSDIYSCVSIHTNNAKVINCTLLENYYGLQLYQANDTLIKGNNFDECEYGIYIPASSSSHNNTIEHNNITNSQFAGIRLWGSNNSTVRRNTVTNIFWYEYAGIYMVDSGNSTVSGNTLTNSTRHGIWLHNSGNSTVHENTVTNNRKSGIKLADSGNSTVSGNTLTNSSEGGIELTRSGNSTVSGNTVTDSNPSGIWFVDSGNSTVSGNTVTNSSISGIELEDSSGHNTVSGNTVTDNGRGIYLDYSGNNNIVSGNTVTNSNSSGIWLSGSDYSTVSGNTVTNSWIGIWLTSSGQSTVIGNTVTRTTVKYDSVSNLDGNGIFLAGSGQSTVSGNTVTQSAGNGILLERSNQSVVSGNTVTDSFEDPEKLPYGYGGIELKDSSSNTTVSGNTVTNSFQYGISLDSSTSGCLLWDNYLAVNAEGNAYDGKGANQWDNGTHGNWYDDYTGGDLNQDGIGDTPYSISGGLVEDRYPLMNLVAPDTSPPTLDSPADVTYTVHSTGHTITWQPSDANPFWYQIFRDGVIVANTTWDGAAITLEIDDLAVGTYNFTIVVLDRLGYRTTDEVLVSVESVEEETTEDESQLIPGFALPLVGLSLAVGLLLTRSRRRKRAHS